MKKPREITNEEYAARRQGMIAAWVAEYVVAGRSARNAAMAAQAFSKWFDRTFLEEVP